MTTITYITKSEMGKALREQRAPRAMTVDNVSLRQVLWFMARENLLDIAQYTIEHEIFDPVGRLS